MTSSMESRTQHALFHRASVYLVALLSLVLTVADGQPAAGTVLYCPIPAYELRFAPKPHLPESLLTAEHAAEDSDVIGVTRAVPLPDITVLVTNSFGAIERGIGPTRMRVRVRGANAETGALDDYIVLSGQFAPVTAGEAIFSRIQVERGPRTTQRFRLRFDAEVLDFSGIRVGGYVLISGPMLLEPATRDGYRMKFHPPAGQAVKYDGDALPVVVSGSPVLDIAIAVLNSAHQVQNMRSLLGVEVNYTVVAAFVPNSTFPAGVTASVVGGASATATRGIVVFDRLTIETNAPEGTVLPPLEFRMYNRDNFNVLRSGPLRVSKFYENHFIAFDTEETSLLYYDRQTLTGQTGATFGTVSISLRNSYLEPSPASTGVVITATIDSVDATLAGGVVGVVDGVATFRNLRVDFAVHTDFRPYVVSFTAGNQGGVRAAGRTLRVVFMLSTAVLPAYRLRFRPTAALSAFTSRDQAAQVTSGALSAPVSVELLDTNNQLSSQHNLTVTVTAVLFSSVEGELQLASGLVVGGRISFTNLDLPSQAPEGAVTKLIFRASSPDAPADGDELVTGALTLSGEVRRFSIEFATDGVSLLSYPGEALFATIGIALPPIVLVVRTSAGIIDSQADGIRVTAAVEGDARASGAFVRTSHGLAVFDALTLVADSARTVKITFTAAGDAGGPVAGKSVETGTVVLVESETSRFRIGFNRVASYVEFPGQVRHATLMRPLPPIVLALVSSTYALPNVSLGVEDTLLAVQCTVIGGILRVDANTSSSRVTAPIVDDMATFDGLMLESGSAPVLEFCVVAARPEGSVQDAVGSCVRSGPVTVELDLVTIAGLAVVDVPGRVLQAHGLPVTLRRGEPISARVVVLDSAGHHSAAAADRRLSSAPFVSATSSYALLGETRRRVDQETGVVDFADLAFAEEVPQGVRPFVTFRFDSNEGSSIRRPTSSGLITVQNPATVTGGVDVVVEILAEFATFDVDAWARSAAEVMNIDAERISPTYTFTGRSGIDDAPFDPVEANFVTPTWEGVRVEVRFLPPLPTSRDTRTPQDIANFFVSLQPSCKLGALSIRRARLKSQDRSCDWLIFESQINGVRSCLQARGKPGFCECHVPLFETFAPRCIGLERLSDLCLDVLISSRAADCQQQPIVSVCTRLEFPDLAREPLMISGMVLFVPFPVIAYLFRKRYFHSLDRPSQRSILGTTRDAGAVRDEPLI